MFKSIIIPSEIIDKGNQFFSSKYISHGQKILENGRISVSFNKSRENRYIISGIVTDVDTFQVKIQYQNENNENKFTSNCNCTIWNESEHCAHSTALFLHYQLSKFDENANSDKTDLKSHISFHGQSVHVDHYGRLENGASRLLGATMNSTYSSLQYLLTSRKTTHFPLPKKLAGTLKINLIPTEDLPDIENHPYWVGKYYPQFSYLDENDVLHEKISIFENLYLFNWETGEAHSIEGTLSHTLKKIRSEGTVNDINHLLKFLHPLYEDLKIDISIQNENLKSIETLDCYTRFSIFTAKRKGFLNFKMELFDRHERLIMPPEIYKTLVGEGGFLNSFRTKNDSYEFIKVLLDSFQYENAEYKKFAYSSSERNKIVDWFDFLNAHKEILFFDQDNKKLYILKSEFFKDLTSAIFDCFSESASRFSFFDKIEKNIYYQFPKSNLFNGISAFYKRMQKYQIPIYYNNVEVKTWSSNIRFERQKSNLDWFEVNLVVNQSDYDIIKNADFGEDYIVSSQGLILLDSKEKELLKFMKKYTKHEAQKVEVSDSNVQKFALNFKRSRIFELFELKKHGIDGALTPEEEQICENLLNMTEMPKYELPDMFKSIARDYQNTGYQWLRFLFENRFGACLADDMGLGKTLQTIMFLQSIIPEVEKILIVCPVSILLNWKNEIEKFSDLDLEIYYGDGRFLKNDKKIIITSYGVMKKESYTTFADTMFDILIMDEVQHLKNIRSLGATAARNLNAKFRICLTGTPVENDLSEFYNIMDLSIPGIWGDLSLVRSKTSKKSRLVARQTVKPFILRRTKDQVLTELPEKVENHVYLNFNEEEKEHYIATLANIRNKMQSVQLGRKYSEILKSLLQLRQLCLWQNNKFLLSTKIDFLMENLEQLLEEGHKVLVFSQFTTYLDHIQNKIRERSWNYARIDGSQNLKKRQSEVDRFQDGDAQVFLISLKAGGVGLNLTAASYIFLMDPWWNPAVENQAIDRAYRIGQENKLTVYRPIIKDSVEEKVLVLQNSKRELFADLMNTDNESFFSGKLSLDDFQNLIT